MAGFRKSTKIGPLRVTASKSGLSVSGGVRGARISANTKGEVRRTLGLPGTGVYDTKRIDGGAGREGRTTAKSSTQVKLEVTDATDDRRDLLDRDPAIAQLKIVGLRDTLYEGAVFAGLTNEKPRAIRNGLLSPSGGGGYDVLLVAYPHDNPSLFGRKDGPDPKAMPFGRLGKADATKWADRLAGRTVMTCIYLDARAGVGFAEVRFLPALLDDYGEDTDAEPQAEPSTPTDAIAAPPPSVPPSWFADPQGQANLRWWDGSAWTEHTHD